MKRVICLLNLLCIASLGCCSLNRRINIIVPGHYFGVDALNESRTCDLIINQISEEEYLKADGKNVIQDAINGNYFSIDFSIIYSEDNIEKVVFTNFIKMIDKRILSIRKSIANWENRILAIAGVDPCKCPNCKNKMRFHDIVFPLILVISSNKIFCHLFLNDS